MAGLHFEITGGNEDLIRKLAESRRAILDSSKTAEQQGAKIEGMFKRMASGAAIFGVGFSSSQFVRDMVNVRGEFQKTQMAFETMLGSKEKADTLMSQMVQTAAKTPFDLQGVANGAKQLLAYGTAAEDVNDTLIRLGNIASGLSIPLGDMVYLYGTTQTQGRLFTQDVRQFMGRGIPLVKELALMLGKTEEEINKMVTAGQIGFSEVEKVIQKMTDEGGKFYNLMEKQSQTLSGQISNLGDAWDQMLNSIGEDTQGLSSATISMTTGVVENYERVGKILAALIVTYGSYKVATIALSVAENIRYQATLAQMAGMTKMQAITDTLRAKTDLLNKTMLSNPWVLLTTIVAGLAITMWILHDSTTAAEKAQKQLNKEHKEAAQRKQELHSKTDTLMSKINSETESVYSQVRAYKELIKLFPELGNMSYEEFKGLPQDQQKKIFSNISEKRESDDAIRAYEADLKRIEELKKRIKEVGNEVTYSQTSSNLNELQKLRNDLEIVNNLAKIHREEIDKIKEAQWEANTPVEEKIRHYEDAKKRLIEEKSELEKTLTKSEGIAAAWMAVPDIIGNIKLDALNKQIDETTGKIDSLTGNDKNAVKNKSYWEQKKKEAETARDALDTAEKNSENWNKYTREIQQAQKEIEKYDTTGKVESEVEKRLKLQSDLSRSILDSELKLQSGRISIMEDGKAKRIALARQETRDTIAAIQKEKEEYRQKAKESKEKVDPTVIKTFDDRELVAKAKEKADIARVEKEYADEYKQRTKALTDVFLNEEERKLSAIKTRYAEERKWADEQLRTGGMTRGQHTSYTSNIDKAEKQETYRGLLDNLNDYKQKEKDIRDKWDTDINAAVEAKDAYLVAKLQEGKQKALSSLNGQMLQESAEWQQLFGNLDNLTVAELEKLSDTIKNKAKDLKLNPVDAQAVTNNLKEVDEKIRTMNPFSLLAKHLKEYDEAENETVKKDRLKEMFRDTAASIDMVRESFDAVVGGLTDMGLAGDEVTQQLLGDISGLMGAASQLATGIASMNPVSIIQGGIGVITSIFNIFNNDKRHEKKIKEIQEEVDGLSRAYDRLGRAIDNTYDAGVYGKMDEQAENLRQQQQLILQQMNEEEAKKKTDDDKMREYRDKYEDLGNQAEDLRNKQVEMLAGTDIQSAIDSFADALTEAYAQGEDGAKAMGETTKKILANAVKEALKKQLLGKALEDAVNQLGKDMEDGILSDSEKRQFEDSANSAGRRFMEAMSMYDELFKGEPTDGVSGQLQAAMTEGTASQLVGLWNSTSIDMRELKQISLANGQTVSSILTDVSEIMRQNILIEQNTRRGADNTDGLIDELRDGFNALDSRLGEIERNTKVSKSRG